MTQEELNEHAAEAIRLAFGAHTGPGFDALRDCVDEIDDDVALIKLYEAAEALGDAVMDIQNERDT